MWSSRVSVRSASYISQSGELSLDRLDLTVACRAYLMEPHWNPTVEEQALARIHRIGQMKEVKTIRFIIRDSYEQEVVKLQECKNELAELLLDPSASKASKSFGSLQVRKCLPLFGQSLTQRSISGHC